MQRLEMTEIELPEMEERTAIALVATPEDEAVRLELFPDGRMLPLIIRPASPHIDLNSWVASNRDVLEQHLRTHGGILFRDFAIAEAGQFEEFIRAFAGDLLDYRERSSPRSRVSGNVFTSTDYPAAKSILLHNENSYQNSWPMRLFFYCATAAEHGGETPLADCRKVLARIDPEVSDAFMHKQWMLVRNFNDGFGLSWQTVFQTEDKAAVEQHCRRQGIEVEWKDGDRLRTRAVRPAITRHPHTGELVWFNHALFFHISSMEPGMREVLLEEFDDDELPSNTFYGDGSSIEPDALAELRSAYSEATVAFAWQQGDVLALDNMLTAHGRAPYAGPRKVLVGMAQPINRQEV
jgi:alpha-ketoglutarate-dependent taurine dioxygenase